MFLPLPRFYSIPKGNFNEHHLSQHTQNEAVTVEKGLTVHPLLKEKLERWRWEDVVSLVKVSNSLRPRMYNRMHFQLLNETDAPL